MRVTLPFLLLLMSTATGCRPERATGEVVDTTFIAAMAELQRVSMNPVLDSTARDSARRAILQRRGLTPEALYQAARALASDEERAMRVWAAIDSAARADTTGGAKNED